MFLFTFPFLGMTISNKTALGKNRAWKLVRNHGQKPFMYGIAPLKGPLKFVGYAGCASQSVKNAICPLMTPVTELPSIFPL